MAAQDKTVKVTIVVDEASAAKAKAAIVAIKQEIDRLVESTNKLGGFLGGMGGTRMGTQAGSPGTSSATQATHGAAGGAMGGVTQAIAGGAMRGAAEIKKTAEATNASFKTMRDNFKTLVDSQDREVRRIETIWGRLRRAMGGGPGGGVGIGGTGGGGAPTIAGGGGSPGVSNPPAAAPPGGKGRGGATTGGFGGFMGGIAQQFGIPPGVVTGGLAAGAVAAGVGIAKMGISASYGNQMANINYALDNEFSRGNARGSLGDIMGGNALAIRHGDMARLHAMKALSNDPSMGAVLGQTQLLELKRQKEHPTDMVNAIAAGRGVEFAKAGLGHALGGSMSGTQSAGATPGSLEPAMDRMRRYGTNFWYRSVMNDPSKAIAVNNARADGGATAIANGMKVGNTNAMVLEQEMSRNQQLALDAERSQRLLDARMREDPGFNDRINTVYGRSGSDTGLMRGLGMSGLDRIVRGADRSGATPGDVRFNAPALIRAKAESEGRDVGEYVAAFSQLAGYGRGLAGNYHSLLSPQTGGLYNTAGIQGVGAQYGGFGNLLGGVQNRIGRGGVDVTAGANIADIGLKAMQSANFLGGQTSGAGGGGLMDTLLSAGFTGQGAGADMLQAKIVSAGMGRREQEAGGGVDGLNKALNMKAAMQAAPEAPWSIRNAIMGLGEAQLLDIVRDPKNMPKALLDAGVTGDMIQKYWSAKNMSGFARFGLAKEYGTDEQRSLVQQYTKSGNLGFLKGRSPEDIDKALNNLAVARAAGGGTIAEARGFLDIQASGIGLKVGGAGRGAHDPFAKGSATAAANAAKGDLGSHESEQMGREGGLYKGDSRDALAGQVHSDSERKKAQAGLVPGANAAQAIQGVSRALTEFVKILQDLAKGDTKSGARQAAP